MVMKIQVIIFCDVIPRNVVAEYKLFGGSFSLHIQPEDEGRKVIRNIFTSLHCVTTRKIRASICIAVKTLNLANSIHLNVLNFPLNFTGCSPSRITLP